MRPGIALYGGRAHEGKPNPMQTVVRLAARILQVRDVGPGETIGYGATYKVQRARAHRHHRRAAMPTASCAP